MGRSLAQSQDIHRQVAPRELVYFENFSPARYTGYNFSFEKFNEDLQLKYKLTANYIRYDTAANNWRLDQWVLREIDDDGVETLKSGRRMDTTFVFEPDQLVPKLFSSTMMKTSVLKKFIKAEKERGSEKLNTYKIELYKRSSWPFSTFVLILIAVSLSTKKSRGGLGLNLAIGLFISLIYIFMMQVSTTFAAVGKISPLLAVWFPNIFFSFLGVYLYIKAPK